jgi:hypothetical protein
MRLGQVICWVTLGSAIGSSAIAAEFIPPCKNSQLIVGECFTVHGRLQEANGGIAVRIWPMGTNRLLGIFDGDGKYYGDEPILPISVGKLLASGAPQSVGVYGDYEVCPLTKEEPEHMQFVCIEKASNLTAQKLAARYPWTEPLRK